MLSSTNLDTMRTTLNASLPDTAVIQRNSGTASYLGVTESWSAVGTAACRYAPWLAQPQERIIAEQFRGQAMYTVMLPHGTDVAAADRIVIGARTFEVVTPLGPRSFEVGLRVAAVEIK